MELDLHQLRTLASVSDLGSFEAAARALSITPSAVSQRIKALETQVGRVLVLRSKPTTLTESGRVVMRVARQLTVLEGDMIAALDLEPGALTTIPLVVNADSLATWFLPSLVGVAGVSFDIVREDQAHSAALLRDGAVMAAVTSVAEPVQGCHAAFLGTMTYRPMASPGWLAQWMPHGFDREALAVAPVVVFDRKDTLQDDYLSGSDIDPLAPPRHHVPGSADFRDAVSLGLGWGMLPDLQADALAADGRLIELEHGRAVAVPLYWQQWSLESRALVAVADAVATTAAVALR